MNTNTKFNIIAIALMWCAVMAGMFIGGILSIPFMLYGAHNYAVVVFAIGGLIGALVSVSYLVESVDDITSTLE